MSSQDPLSPPDGGQSHARSHQAGANQLRTHAESALIESRKSVRGLYSTAVIAVVALVIYAFAGDLILRQIFSNPATAALEKAAALASAEALEARRNFDKLVETKNVAEAKQKEAEAEVNRLLLVLESAAERRGKSNEAVKAANVAFDERANELATLQLTATDSKKTFSAARAELVNAKKLLREAERRESERVSAVAWLLESAWSNGLSADRSCDADSFSNGDLGDTLSRLGYPDVLRDNPDSVAAKINLERYELAVASLGLSSTTRYNTDACGTYKEIKVRAADPPEKNLVTALETEVGKREQAVTRATSNEARAESQFEAAQSKVEAAVAELDSARENRNGAHKAAKAQEEQLALAKSATVTANLRVSAAANTLETLLNEESRITTRLNDQIAADNKAIGEASDITSVVTRGVATAGAIGIAFMLMQVFVSQSRYYARLAERYRTQAIAFEMASGDPNLALKMAQAITPSELDFGKVPASIYEKIIDTLGSVAKSPRTAGG